MNGQDHVRTKTLNSASSDLNVTFLSNVVLATVVLLLSAVAYSYSRKSVAPCMLAEREESTGGQIYTLA